VWVGRGGGGSCRPGFWREGAPKGVKATRDTPHDTVHHSHHGTAGEAKGVL
jgi:hypothetical protein